MGILTETGLDVAQKEKGCAGIEEGRHVRGVGKGRRVKTVMGLVDW